MGGAKGCMVAFGNLGSVFFSGGVQEVYDTDIWCF